MIDKAQMMMDNAQIMMTAQLMIETQKKVEIGAEFITTFCFYSRVVMGTNPIQDLSLEGFCFGLDSCFSQAITYAYSCKHGCVYTTVPGH